MSLSKMILIAVCALILGAVSLTLSELPPGDKTKLTEAIKLICLIGQWILVAQLFRKWK